MPRSCCVWGCTARGGSLSETKFYGFPNSKKNFARREKWIAAVRSSRMVLSSNKCLPDGVATGLGKIWEPKKWDCVCQRHFVTGEPNNDLDHPDYVPSLHMTGTPTKTPKIDRCNRIKRRSNFSLLPSTSSSTSKLQDDQLTSSPFSTPPPEEELTCNNSSCVRKIASLEENIKYLKQHCERLEMENSLVRTERDNLKRKPNRDPTHPAYVPTIFIHSPDDGKSAEKLARYAVKKKREKAVFDEQLSAMQKKAKAAETKEEEVKVKEEKVEEEVSKVQEDKTGLRFLASISSKERAQYLLEIDSLKCELQSSKATISKLEEKLKVTLQASKARISKLEEKLNDTLHTSKIKSSKLEDKIRDLRLSSAAVMDGDEKSNSCSEPTWKMRKKCLTKPIESTILPTSNKMASREELDMVTEGLSCLAQTDSDYISLLLEGPSNQPVTDLGFSDPPVADTGIRSNDPPGSVTNFNSTDRPSIHSGSTDNDKGPIKSVYRKEFYSMKQNPCQSFTEYVTTLRRKASQCSFNVCCSNAKCGQMVSYADEMVSDLLMGCKFPGIQKQVVEKDMDVGTFQKKYDYRQTLKKRKAVKRQLGHEHSTVVQDTQTSGEPERKKSLLKKMPISTPGEIYVVRSDQGCTDPRTETKEAFTVKGHQSHFVYVVKEPSN